MGATRRKFTLEFKTEAAHRVIDSGRNIPEVASELSISQEALYRWVKDDGQIEKNGLDRHRRCRNTSYGL